MNDSRLSERACPFLAKIREIVSLIRDNADRAEREAQLPPAVVEVVHQRDCSGSFCRVNLAAPT
jgi:SH3-like domain-containing protein